MTIQKYEDWMRPQIVALFNMEYGTAQGEFDQLFVNFYEHPFQREQGIRIVAVDGERIAGFQSFFYWPLSSGGRTLKSFQSGNSLVHPDYRGKGLFGKMLNYIHEEGSGFSFDVLIGFPVEASYNSFIRNKWLNPFNLQWHVRLMNPVLSLFSNPEQQMEKHWPKRKSEAMQIESTIVCVQQSHAYDDYRFVYQKRGYYRFHYSDEGHAALFEVKVQRRKKIIKELIIGKFLTTTSDAAFIENAFGSLVKEVKRKASFTLLSVAINPLSETLNDALAGNGFKKIDRHIYFIAKGPLADEVKDWSNWWMYRADIDTW
ncbi:MAG: GNAT family N-acetyltransferase [Flavobacteriales bacterium]